MYHRILNAPSHGFLPLYQWDLVCYTTARYSTCYTWIPSYDSAYNFHSILLIPMEGNARYFVVRQFASRLSDRERLPVPILAIEPFFINAHSKDDNEAHRAYRLVSKIDKRRQTQFRLPFHPAAVRPDINDPYLKNRPLRPSASFPSSDLSTSFTSSDPSSSFDSHRYPPPPPDAYKTKYHLSNDDYPPPNFKSAYYSSSSSSYSASRPSPSPY
jgi:hypothetical protein